MFTSNKQRKGFFSNGINELPELQQNNYYAVKFRNPRVNHDSEKLIGAKSKQDILDHRDNHFGHDDIKILDIDDKPYKNAKSEAQAEILMRKRFGYHVEDGTRVYH
jgi:hypothetical protein